jgi:hypothetical protein
MEYLLDLDYVNPIQEIPLPIEARQKTPDTAISVKERVNGLELVMDEVTFD